MKGFKMAGGYNDVYKIPYESMKDRGEFPAFSAGSFLAGPLLQSLFPQAFGGETSFNLTSPEKYRDQLTLSNADLSEMETGALRTTGRVTSKVASDIKQQGILGNESGTQTALAELGTNVAKGVGENKGRLKRTQKELFGKYFNMLNNYELAKQRHEDETAASRAGGLQSGLGGLSKLLTLWEGGIF